jgi:hypothetical protein
VYVVGETGGDLHGQDNAGMADAFIIRRNANGVGGWTRLAGEEFQDVACGVAVSSDGNVFLAINTQVHVDNELGLPDGWRGVALLKYDSTGLRLWERIIADGDPFDMTCRDLAIDEDDAIYIVGDWTADMFLTKYNKDGFVQWTRRNNGGEQVTGMSVATDHDGHVYAVGAGNPLGVPLSSGYSYIVRYTTDGDLSWARGSSVYGRTVSANPTGSVYFGGLVLNGEAFAMLDASGTERWQNHAPDDFTVHDLALSSSGDVYVSGTYEGATLDGRDASGGADIVVLKYDAEGNKL